MPTRQGRGRPRKRHADCTRPDDLPAGTTPLTPALTAIPGASRTGRAAVDGSLEAATLVELEAAGRQETSAGVEALALARMLDAGGNTAQGAVALAKGRREALAAALAGAKPADDGLSELERRRLAKASGA